MEDDGRLSHLEFLSDLVQALAVDQHQRDACLGRCQVIEANQRVAGNLGALLRIDDEQNHGLGALLRREALTWDQHEVRPSTGDAREGNDLVEGFLLEGLLNCRIELAVLLGDGASDDALQGAQAIVFGKDALRLLVHYPNLSGLVDDHDTHEEAVKSESGLVEGINGAPLRSLQDFLPGFLRPMNGARLHPRNLIETSRDGREQDLIINGFDQIVVRSGLFSDQDVVAFSQGREEDEGHVDHVSLLAQGFENIIAAKPGHGDVAKDKIRPMLFEKRQGLAAVGCLKHAIVGSFQLLGEVAPEIVFVFNAENCFVCCHNRGHSCSLLRLIRIGDG